MLPLFYCITTNPSCLAIIESEPEDTVRTTQNVPFSGFILRSDSGKLILAVPASTQFPHIEVAMKHRYYFLTIIICLLAFTVALQANNVFVLPDGNQSQTVNVFAAEPFVSAGSFAGPQGLALDTIASPDSPVRYWTYGDTPTDTVVAVNQNMSELFRSGPSAASAQNGVVTPDGQRILLAADTLRIYNAATFAEIIPDPPLDVGQAVIDVAVSIDSRYAYVLSSASQLLTRVDLSTYTVDGTIPIPGQTVGVAVGPDSLVYVSVLNQVLIIDGESMTVLGNIIINGRPAKMYFTPDGRYGIAINRTPITNATCWVFDLVERNLAGTIQALFGSFSTPIQMDDKVVVASNRRVFLTSKMVNSLYVVNLSPGIGIDSYNIGGVGAPNGVIAAAASNEMKGDFADAQHLFYATANKLYRVDLATDQLSGNPQTVNGNVNRLAYARQPSVDSPTAFIMYNNNQAIALGETFRPIIIRALDIVGRPVFGAQVSFASALPDVTFENASQTTNLDGLAMAFVNPGELEGVIPVTVTIGAGLIADFNISIGGNNGNGGPAGGIFRVSGNGQLIAEEENAPDPSGFNEAFRAIVRNQFGEPVAGANVEWSLSGPGLLTNLDTYTSGSTVTTTTDANGETHANFISLYADEFKSYTTSYITATYGDSSVDFIITTYQTEDENDDFLPIPLIDMLTPSSGNRTIVGKSGEVIEDAIRVRVLAGAGEDLGLPIPNISLEASTGLDSSVGPVASCTIMETLTGDDGIATCDLLLGGLGTAYINPIVGQHVQLPALTITVTPGDPAAVTILTGNNQEGDPGDMLPVPLSARITDAYGNPLPGSQAQWEVINPGSATLSNVVSEADAQGRVSAMATLGSTPGQIQVRVTSGAGSATFTLNSLVQIEELNKFSGDDQVVQVNTQFPQPLVVQLKDDEGQPVPGQDVGVAVISGSATVGTPIITTNQQGLASVIVTAGVTPGAVIIAATFPGLPTVNFYLTVQAPGPAVVSSSFVNGASWAPGVVPGSVVNIVAPGLAPIVQNCVTAPAIVGSLPYELAGVSVQFGPDSAPLYAPIYHVCNVNGMESVAVQAPAGLQPGVTQATIRVGTSSTTVQNIPVLNLQPGIFEMQGSTGLPYGVILRPDGSLVSPQNPAARGEIVYLFATGLGATNPPIITNSPGIPGQEIAAEVVVGVNNGGVRVVSAEYIANAIGLYVVSFEIPENMVTGDAIPLALAVNLDGNMIFGNGSSIAIQ